MKSFIIPRKTIIAFIASLFIVILSGCGSSKEVISTWSGQAIQIDGNSQDWQGNLEAFPKENYSIGTKNDGKFLYLCFITSDRDKIIKIMRSGLSVEFDTPADKAKNYTIKFPIINPAIFRESIQALGPDALQKESIGFLFQDILDKQLQFELIENDYLNTISLKNNENIEVKMGTSKELLVYELKVPLALTQSSFPIGAMPGEKINIKIETDPSSVAFREGQNANAGAPGAGASGGNKGGRSGSRRPVSQPSAGSDAAEGGPINMVEKFSVQFSLLLAKEIK